MGSILVTYHTLELNIVALSQKQPIPIVNHVSILDVFKNIQLWGYESQKRLFGGQNRFCGLIPLIEIDEPNNCIKLIFTLSDKDEDYQLARHFNTGVVRSLDRDEEEGADKRVHVVIKLNPSNKYQAKFCIEHKQGVPTRLFVETLNYFMKSARMDTSNNAANYFIGKHPTECETTGPNIGQAKPQKFKIRFEHTSEMSQEIINAFASGKIESVEFYEDDQNPTLFDPTGTFAKKRTLVVLNVTGQLIRQSSNTFTQKFSDFKNGFTGLFAAHPDLKGLRFKINFMDVNKNRYTAVYDSQYEELVWAKKKHLNKSLRQRMTEAPSLNHPLCDRMFANIT